MHSPNSLRSVLLLAVAIAFLAAPSCASAQEGVLDDQPPASQEPIDWTKPVEVGKRMGPVLWPLLICSLLTITFGLERLISLRRRRVLTPSFVRRFLKRIAAGDIDRATAMDACRTQSSSSAHLLLVVVRNWGKPTAEIQKAVAEAEQMEVLILKRNLRYLQGLANVATLLGLLGTVLGMIKWFNEVGELRGADSARLLTGGIAEALLTTAFGLTIAIPAICLYMLYAAKVERLVYELDEIANDAIDLVSAESLGSKRDGEGRAETSGVVRRRWAGFGK